ncbi:MAG: MFS transporter [Pseudomonadota bacterium]
MAQTADLKTPGNPAKKEKASAWAPFGYKSFAVLWTATVISNTGTWMHDVGAGWLMTDLAPSPAMVAAVQAANTLPVFLFALFAGAIADIVDRRWMLISVNAFLAVTATALAILVGLNAMTPLLLLVFTFAMGTGAAFMAPAWQAIVPSLVDRKDLSSAVALNSMGINVSRAIGPAIAGFLIVAAGLVYPFLINAISIVTIIFALLWWTPPPKKTATLPPEHVPSAIWSGLRYAWYSAPLRSTIVRAAAFFIFASAYWAMLPLIAKNMPNGGAGLYGILLTSVGAGAVIGALLLPQIRGVLGTNGSVILGSIGTAVTLSVFALVQNPIAAAGASGLAGLCWIAVLSSLNVSAQTSLPDWVRARGLSIFLTVFFGSMSIGSVIWGQVATQLSIDTALLVAAAGLLLFIPLTLAAKLGQGESMDLRASAHWSEPVLAEGVEDTGGPVMIQIRYLVAGGHHQDFLDAINALSKARRRAGAFSWSIMQDAEHASIFVETWFEASWTQHIRHHDRVTEEDMKLKDAVNVFLNTDEPPIVSHFVTGSANTPPPTLTNEAL